MTTLHFESATCPRCGGTGRMPFAAYGGVCFKCKGVGQVLTPAGRSARKLYEELMARVVTEVEASSLVAGQRVFSSADAAAKGTPRRTVVEVRPTSQTRESYAGSFDIVCQKVIIMGVRTAWVRPDSETVVGIYAEVARRRKGATLNKDEVAV